MNKVLVLKYEKGFFSPKVLLASKDEKTQEIISLAKEKGIPIREDSNLLESLWNHSSQEKGKEGEIVTILSDFLYCIYEIEERDL